MPFELEKARQSLDTLPNQREASWVRHRLSWIGDSFRISAVKIDESTLDDWEAGAVHLRILEQYGHTRDWGYSDTTRQAILDIATDFAIETALDQDMVTKNWRTMQEQ
ncbi:MAG TPA: hypothetical protein VLE69_01450 [Candidatus Saccharimonadales bacterium]|nr:hypothetical protein [Candidatus Saccharimonadales bacterium]